MAYDAINNFAYTTVATAPSPPNSGTSLVVNGGDGALFPAVSFNATVWPAGTNPTTSNAEIVRVTNISTDTFTITRTQEGTSARTIAVGDQLSENITAKTLTDVQNAFPNGAWTSYTPTWTGGGSNPAIGNGTLAGFYMQLGKTVFVRIEMTAGSSTTFGTGTWFFALPVTAKTLSAANANDATQTVGQGAVFGAAYHPAMVNLATTTTAQLRAFVTAAGSNPVFVSFTAPVSQGTPETLANTQQLYLNFTYEAA